MEKNKRVRVPNEILFHVLEIMGADETEALAMVCRRRDLLGKRRKAGDDTFSKCRHE